MLAERAARADSRPTTHDSRLSWTSIPLFWRLVLINLVVVLGGALLGTWLTQRLVLSGTFTPLTHGMLVLALLGISAALTMAMLRETFRPIRSLRAVIHRYNAGDHSARAELAPFTDPDVAALVHEMNALWDRLNADAATIREKTDQAERLAAEVISAQEEERRRVARELHDEAGQALTALIIGLERGLATMPQHVQVPDSMVQPRALMSDLRDLAAQTLDEVRKLALELRPSVLDDLGLVAAVRQYVRASGERSGLATHVTVNGLDEADRLPAAIETALFRIAQEAVTNTIRHAHAESVQVCLRREPEAVSLEVRDDGVGLGANGSTPGPHLGVFGMRERAHLLGGDVSVLPAPSRGTLVRVRLPLARA
jgi:two-component system, NarL family, sensor histidine kinase UhpB